MQVTNSLDPRVNRLPKAGQPQMLDSTVLHQFITFEVFVQPKDGKPFQHEGSIHAPDLEMAFVLAKETFTRRFTCSSLCVVDTRNVYTSPLSEGNQSAYDILEDVVDQPEGSTDFEIYHLLKRGKQHVHAGTVRAVTPAGAMNIAKQELKTDKTVYSIWAVRREDIRFTADDERDLWLTLPEKKFRDAADYKGGDKLKLFLEQQ